MTRFPCFGCGADDFPSVLILRDCACVGDEIRFPGDIRPTESAEFAWTHAGVEPRQVVEYHTYPGRDHMGVVAEDSPDAPGSHGSDRITIRPITHGGILHHVRKLIPMWHGPCVDDRVGMESTPDKTGICLKHCKDFNHEH